MKQFFFWCMSIGMAHAQTIVVRPTTCVVALQSLQVPSINNEGRIRIGDSVTLTGTGTYTGSGTYAVGSHTTLWYTKHARGTLMFAAAANTLGRLIVEGEIRIGSTLQIRPGASPGYVRVLGGTIWSDSTLYIRADEGGCAYIDSSFGSILGPVIVEQYFPPRRAWRLLSVPFEQTTQSINQAWQEGYTNPTLSCPPDFPGTSGYGTEITYDGQHGYDKNTTSNPSLLVFTGNTWNGFSSVLTTKLTDYPGYMLFVRGDRTICLSLRTQAVPVATTLRPSGTLFMGTVEYTTSQEQGEYVFGRNPYVSPIRILPVLQRSRGVRPQTYWMWDPNIGGLYGVGGYVLYDDGVITPRTATYPDEAHAEVLQAGQGFFMQSDSAVSTIICTEQDKTSVQAPHVFGRPLSTKYVRVELKTHEGSVLDGALIRVLTDTTHKRVKKFWNMTGESVVVGRDDQVVDVWSETDAYNRTPLYIRRPKEVEYQLVITHTLEDSLWLVDSYEGKTYEVHDSLTLSYNILPTDSTTFYERFWLLRRKVVPMVPAPIVTGLTLMPNPVHETLRIMTQSPVVYVRIRSLLGQVVYSGGSKVIDCRRFASGLYVLEELYSHQTKVFQKL